MNHAQEAMALLALSHSPIEHRLYEKLLSETPEGGPGFVTYSLQGLMSLTGLNSYSTVRRARNGLVEKLSIDCRRSDEGGACEGQQGSLYTVYRPEEVFERRRLAGLDPYPKEYRRLAGENGFSNALVRVAGEHNLSRREAQVALCCAEGLTNAEIGDQLSIAEQTVKFHLRHVFVKFGVRRRNELTSRLLRQREPSTEKV